MRNALTSLEQTIAFGEGKVTLAVAERMLGGVDSGDLANIVQALGKRDAAACFNWVAEFVESGSDLAQFARELAQHVRNLYVMSLAGTDVALDVSASERRQLADELPAVRHRSAGTHAAGARRRHGRAENLHQPAPVLRDRLHAHGAPRRRPDACRACGTRRGLGAFRGRRGFAGRRGAGRLGRLCFGSCSRDRCARCCRSGCGPCSSRAGCGSGGRTAGGSSPGRCRAARTRARFRPRYARGPSGPGSCGPCVRSVGPGGRARSCRARGGRRKPAAGRHHGKPCSVAAHVAGGACRA